MHFCVFYSKAVKVCVGMFEGGGWGGGGGLGVSSQQCCIAFVPLCNECSVYLSTRSLSFSLINEESFE